MEKLRFIGILAYPKIDISQQINKQRGILCTTVKAFTTLISFYVTQIINSFLTSRISVNHDKGLGFSQTGNPYMYSLMLLQCRISFIINHDKITLKINGCVVIHRKRYNSMMTYMSNHDISTFVCLFFLFGERKKEWMIVLLYTS